MLKLNIKDATYYMIKLLAETCCVCEKEMIVRAFIVLYCSDNYRRS